MKLVDSIRSVFKKVAGHPVTQSINDNAAKLAACYWGCGDVYFFAQNSLDSLSEGAKTNPTHNALSFSDNEMKAAIGFNFILANMLLSFVDKNNWFKKPIGLMSFAGAAGFVSVGQPLAAVAPAFFGASLLFEDSLNKKAHDLSERDDLLAKAAKIYLKYPVAVGSLTQIFSSTSYLLGATEFKDAFYASYWVMGSIVSPMMDNNIKAAIRAAAPDRNSPRAEMIS